ncbi:MAG: hypothetical protein ACXW5W_17345 [Candidatus Binatia bacterium]
MHRIDNGNSRSYDFAMTKTISLRVDPRLLRTIDSATKKSSKAQSDVVNEVLELWLKRRTAEDKVRRHREGYAHYPVGKDEFSLVLKAQSWPK